MLIDKKTTDSPTSNATSPLPINLIPGCIDGQAVTAKAIVLSADRGKLSLDDDIRAHLPEMPDYGKPITIRHLIHHSSGLRGER